MDSLYWNATLRTNFKGKDDTDKLQDEETAFVYGSGLVALSLMGNKLSGDGIVTLATMLGKNCWLLGEQCY